MAHRGGFLARLITARKPPQPSTTTTTPTAPAPAPTPAPTPTPGWQMGYTYGYKGVSA